MKDLLIGLDDKQLDLRGKPSQRIRTRFLDMIDQACEDFQGLDVQLKLNVAARAYGHETIELIENAGLTVFLDYKFGQLAEADAKKAA